MRILAFVLVATLFIFAKEIEMKDFIESGFGFERSFVGQWDDKKIQLTRYTRTKELNFGGEHISFVFDSDKKLFALARILAKYKKDKNFSLEKEEAKDIAISFLEKYAPDLLENYKISWIDFHDETLRIDNQKLKISGLKVKCQNLNDNRYFWVIVGEDKSIIVFERDVVWDFLKAGRQTQKWIHDSWLKGKIK